MRFLLGGLFLGLLAWGCAQAPDYPVEPIIEIMDLNKTTIAQGNQNASPDTLLVRFSFTDGDGDIGFPDDVDTVDTYLTDSRDGFINRFRLPTISTQGVGKGISGEVTLRIPNRPFRICCTFPNGATACQPNPQFPTDTFSYAIQIRDRAGNFSNTVRTETITILCN